MYKERSDFMQLTRYKYIAHRGLHNKDINILENTIEAFENAIKNEYAIELDVQLTKDEQIIVFHDYNLKRMTNKDIYVKDLTLNELKNIPLNNASSTIPTLDEVLKLVDGKVPLLIEIKNEGMVSKLEDKLIDILKKYNGEFMLESFNPFVVRYLKKKTNYFCGILVCKVYNNLKGKIVGTLFKLLLLLNMLNVDFIAYKFKDLDKRVMDRISKKKIPLYLWTIDNGEDFKKASKCSNGVIFENILPK